MKKATAIAALLVLLVTTTGLAEEPLFAPAINYAAGDSPRSVFACDLDGDGDADLAVTGVNILKNNGDGTFADPVSYAAGDSPWSVFATDLDDDGDADLAVTNIGNYPDWTGTVSVLRNNGDGTFADAVSYATGGAWSNSIYATDLDGDGDADLAVANQKTDNVSVLINNGDGTFAAAVNYSAGVSPESVCASDLDGDGDADLAVADGDSWDVSILINSGDGTFAPPVNYGAFEYPTSVFASDLDGDGDADLAVCADWGSLVLLKNSGDGTFSHWAHYWLGDEESTRSVFASDLDLDGDADLAVTRLGRFPSETGFVSILTNNGLGGFPDVVDYSVGVHVPHSVFASDLDGDGDADLAVGGDSVSILINLTVCCKNRGDVNHDEVVDALDLQYLRDYLHKDGAEEPPCFEEADVNGDGEINGQDISCLTRYVYSTGNPCVFAPCQ